MNGRRGRGGRTPSTPSSGQYWCPVSNRAAATSNEVSPVSDSGNSSHARRGRPEQVLETVNVSTVQRVDEDTEHLEKMNSVRGRGSRTPSTQFSGQTWRQISNRATATWNEVSPVSDSGSSHARHGRPEQKEVLETVNVSIVQRVDEDTEHFEKMNRVRGRGGRTPSTPFSGQSWRPISNRAAATSNEVSPVSDNGNSNHARRGRPEQEVLELAANVSRVQLVGEYTDNRVSPSDMITPSGDVKASGMSHSSNYNRKSGLSQDFMSPETGSSISVDGDAKLQSPKDMVKPFDICLSSLVSVLNPSLLSKNREKRNQMKRSKEGADAKILRPGMVLLKSYLSIDDQVKIVKICRELGKGPGGFYKPGYRDGAKLNLRMMCLGKNWDPKTSHYVEKRPIDGAIPPKIPDEFNQFVENAIKDCHDAIKKQTWEPNVEKVLPWMKPDICLVNFYSSNGRLGLHQDRDESKSSLKKGLPVVSFSIGDTAEFLYSDQGDVEKADKVSLKSGDVLVFGGESRHIFHGVAAIEKDTAPISMKDESKLLPGRLNLTFRQY